MSMKNSNDTSWDFFLFIYLRLFNGLPTCLQVHHVFASVYIAECLSVSLLSSIHVHFISWNYSSTLL